MAHEKKKTFEEAANDDWKNRTLSNTERTRSEHIEKTKSTHWEARKATDLETFSIRLHPDDKRRLSEYFGRRSTPLSQGIRQVLVDFMQANDL